MVGASIVSFLQLQCIKSTLLHFLMDRFLDVVFRGPLSNPPDSIAGDDLSELEQALDRELEVWNLSQTPLKSNANRGPLVGHGHFP